MRHQIGAISLDLGLVLVACAIAGCRMIPVAMPAVDDVDRIVVNGNSNDWRKYFPNDHPGFLDEPPLTRSIEDRDRIAQIIALLATHNRGWHPILDTPPNSTHCVTLERDHRVVFSFWLDRTYMGSYFGDVYKVREIDAEESKRFHELLGIEHSLE